MKHRIAALLSALALVVAGLVGVAAVAGPASAAQNTRVCYLGSSITAAPGVRVGTGDIYTLPPNQCKTHPSGIRAICAASRNLVINNSVILQSGRCYNTTLNSTYNVRLV